MGRTFVRNKRRGSSLLGQTPDPRKSSASLELESMEGWEPVTESNASMGSAAEAFAGVSSVAKNTLHTKKKKRQSYRLCEVKIDVDEEGKENCVAGQPPSAWTNMSKVGDRIQSFTDKSWHRSLLTRKSKCTPEKMAVAGWFCTGKRSAMCYACLKEMDEWEDSDDPILIHAKRCQQCPLEFLRPKPYGVMTIRELIRLNVVIEYFHKKKALEEEMDTVMEAFGAAKTELRGYLRDLGATVESDEEDSSTHV
ncbi:hypothetical protein RvY_04379 [Ramazzottius varieornatus]|uniref:Uncharacterized protein n=1 Tax=Ramazzottius varieornatus TaxID=947166 RepID=A0A1D1URF2_RAMVA|nr:hypothetical protein RvY_04379 [Ramazzottius varieornatus]